ncbi:OmpA family protein [uncultured Cohaesibacter sp.]|uniref:OmpA family protein n=1 Tax=uncultured Cohaesibacter sp. TaxID=1002546 RepID=UPI0029C69FFA|nr:OmpA family protein [uncultured Cohaesibacter sp.]
MAKLSLALTLAICASAATLAHAQAETVGDPVVKATEKALVAEKNSQVQNKIEDSKDKSAELSEVIKSGNPDADVRIIIETLEPTEVVSHLRDMTRPFALEIVQPAFAGTFLTDYNHATELSLLFSDKSTVLSEEAKQALIPLGHALRSEQLKAHSYLIGVHTDAQGDTVYNDQLSHFRAEAIKAFLVDAFAIDQARLVTVGWGGTQAQTPSKSAVCRQSKTGSQPDHRHDQCRARSAADHCVELQGRGTQVCPQCRRRAPEIRRVWLVRASDTRWDE